MEPALRGAGLRWDPAGCLRRRGSWSGWSSSAPAAGVAAVRIDARAIAGADVCGRVHRDFPPAQGRPCGSRPLPSPARTPVVVSIAVSFFWDLSRSRSFRCRTRRRPGRSCRWGRCWSLRPPGCAWLCSSRSPSVVQGLPCGSKPLPSPARTCVFVFIAISSRCSGVTVGVDGAPDARVHISRGLHRRLPCEGCIIPTPEKEC